MNVHTSQPDFTEVAMSLSSLGDAFAQIANDNPDCAETAQARRLVLHGMLLATQRLEAMCRPKPQRRAANDNPDQNVLPFPGPGADA